MWYRSADESQWHTGVTETVSATGALIRVEESVPTAQPVHVVIALPSAAGCLIGTGRLVQTPEPDEHPAARFAIGVGKFHIRSKAVLKRIA